MEERGRRDLTDEAAGAVAESGGLEESGGGAGLEVTLAVSDSAGQWLASMTPGSTTPLGAGCFQGERLAGEGASWGVGSGETAAAAGGSMAARG